MSASNCPVSMRPCKRLCVVQSCDNEDRISELPDGVIGLILSRVPIRDAVKTSVLSRDWEHKWTFMCDIEINDRSKKSRPGKSKTAHFINFISRILTRTHNSSLKRFSLICNSKYDPSFLETWISNVLTRNLESLKICGYQVGRLDSRWCFSGWTSLTELNICLSCTLVLPVDNYCFRKLKSLRLLANNYHGNLKIRSGQIPTTGRVVLTFPVLEDLFLGNCEWLDVNFVEIHAPELMSFEAGCSVENKNYEIKIFAAKLAKFESHGGLIENFDLHTQAVSCAKLSHDSPTSKHEYLANFLPRSRKVLKRFSDVKYLKLSGDIVKALIPSLMWGDVFPTFGQLKELHLCSAGYTIEDLLNLLLVLPPLESLTVSVLLWVDDCEKGYPWPPKIVSNLKKCKFLDFSRTHLQYDFSKYVLENARDLEEMLAVLPKTENGFKIIREREKIINKLFKLKPKNSRCRLVSRRAEVDVN